MRLPKRGPLCGHQNGYFGSTFFFQRYVGWRGFCMAKWWETQNQCGAALLHWCFPIWCDLFHDQHTFPTDHLIQHGIPIWVCCIGLTIQLKTTILNWVEISPQFKIIITPYRKTPLQQWVYYFFYTKIKRRNQYCPRLTFFGGVGHKILTSSIGGRSISACMFKIYMYMF